MATLSSKLNKASSIGKKINLSPFRKGGAMKSLLKPRFSKKRAGFSIIRSDGKINFNIDCNGSPVGLIATHI
jgi:hypothetical protein